MSEKRTKKRNETQSCVSRDTVITTRNQWLVLEMEA